MNPSIYFRIPFLSLSEGCIYRKLPQQLIDPLNYYFFSYCVVVSEESFDPGLNVSGAQGSLENGPLFSVGQSS